MLAGIPKNSIRSINNITGTKEDNPMPLGDSDMEIAQSFVEYFVEKIDKNQRQI